MPFDSKQAPNLFTNCDFSPPHDLSLINSSDRSRNQGYGPLPRKPRHMWHSRSLNSHARCAETIIFRPPLSTLLTDFTQSGTLAEAVTNIQLDLSSISGTDTRPELLTLTLAAIAYRVRLTSLTIAKDIYLLLKLAYAKLRKKLPTRFNSRQHGSQEFFALKLIAASNSRLEASIARHYILL